MLFPHLLHRGTCVMYSGAEGTTMTGIFSGMRRGVPRLHPRQMTPPATCFEAEDAIRNAGSLQYGRLPAGRVFLGLLDASIGEDDQGKLYARGGRMIGIEDDRHIITVAGSRTGKGRCALIPNMLLYEGSVLAIDPKGELALATAQTRGHTQRVYVLDPFDETKRRLPPEYYSGFNPMAFMRAGPAAIEDAILITDALVMPGGHDPHWDESAKTLIEGVILEAFTAERFKGHKNLVTVRDLICEGDKTVTAEELFGEEKEGATQMDVLAEFMRRSSESAVRRAGSDFFERPERERDSVLSTARRHLRALAFPEIEASLQENGFDLSDLKTSRMTVYLCLPGRHMGTCGRWLRLFVNLALQAMEKTDMPAVKGRPPVLFVMDEFASLGHMKQIEDAAGQIAGYGVKLWPVLQDLGQLKALYKERWETFMGNAGVLQFFGNNDLTTLEWISKRLGNTTIEQLSSSALGPGAREAGAPGESYAPHTVPVLEPNEVALIFGREDPQLRQLIIQAGFAPMILHRAYWDKHEAFQQLRPPPG